MISRRIKMAILSSQYIKCNNKFQLSNRAQKIFTSRIDAKCGYARVITFYLPHGPVPTPVYMPVGTKGAIKGITSQQMEQMNCKIMLSNAYHIANKPGAQFLGKIKGLHNFMGWKNNLLTDSGGYQMISLSQLCQISQKGVMFKSPYDQSTIFIGPQQSIFIQNQIGSDIMMALDDVAKPTSQRQRIKEAMERTVRWIDRNIISNKNIDKQTLFPIVQGGLDFQLRRKCVAQMNARESAGYAIGGLSGGQSKQDFFKIVRLCCSMLPEQKPRYLMGVGYPVDLVLCILLGVDMFDCVFSTRTARFGTVFTSNGPIKIKHNKYQKDFSPIQQGCSCESCVNFTKAYLHLISRQQNVGHLLSIHNISFLFSLMSQMRQAIIEGNISEWVRKFLNSYYSNQGSIPDWVQIALHQAQINITLDYPWSTQSSQSQINQ